MYITKNDAAFYAFEDVALIRVLGITKKDFYISEDEIKDLMAKVSNTFNIQCPEFAYTRTDSRYCYYRPLNHTIYFNKRFGFTKVIVLHELCHALTDHEAETHGSDYVRVWMDVMSRMFDVDVTEFEKIADERKIKYTKQQSAVPQQVYVPKY